MAKKIYIGKLSKSVTRQQLYDHFSKIGTVISAEVIDVISFQQNINYGYITMSNEEETKQAIVSLNNSILGKSPIKVTEAHFLDQEKPDISYKRSKRY